MRTPPRSPAAASSSASRRSALGAGSPIARRRTRRPSAGTGGSCQSMAPSGVAPARQLGGGQLVEQRVVVGRQPRESTDAIDGAGPQLPRGAAAARRARGCAGTPGRRSTGRRGTRCRPRRAARAASPRRSREERPHDAAAARRDAAHAGQPAAAQQVEQHGLGRVVGGVGGGDQRALAARPPRGIGSAPRGRHPRSSAPRRAPALRHRSGAARTAARSAAAASVTKLASSALSARSPWSR